MIEGFILALPDTITEKKLDSAVMIRFIEEQDGKMFLRVEEGLPVKVT